MSAGGRGPGALLRPAAARWAVLAALALFVELAPRLRWIDALTLVPLSTMVARLWRLVSGGAITPHIVSTSFGVVGSFALAAGIGIPAGVLLWRFGWLRRALDPYLSAYYALPIFALYPFLISAFGMGYLPIIAIATAWAVVAVAINTAAGLLQVRPVYGKLARSLGLGPWRAFFSVYFPAAARHVFAGLKLAVSYAVIGVVASEFILAPRGLGWLISYHYNNFGLADMYASILLVLSLSTLTGALVSRIEGRIWRRRAG